MWSLVKVVAITALVVLPTSTASAEPEVIPTATPAAVSTISVGPIHSCAVTASGAATCWGYNADGRLGDGTTYDSALPVPVVGLGSGVTAIAAGVSHSCALTAAGAVKCWGANNWGQLGNASTTDSAVPVQVSGLTSGVVAVATGFGYSCAVTGTGAARCWGYNGTGQLGNGSTTGSSVPVQVTGLTSGITKISAGSGMLAHSCAVTAAGAAVCWGANGDGELGDGTDYSYSLGPVAVSGLSTGVRDIDAGNSHTCAVTQAGAARCWGYNAYGQLGTGTAFTSFVPLGVIGLDSGVGRISAGLDHTCAATTGGVRCWGYNGEGQLGDGTTDNRSTPVVAAGLGAGALAVATGDYHSCAATALGAARCWGSNGFGQLGTGTPDSSLVPVGVSGLSTGQAPAMLRVVTSPAVPSQISVDGAIADTWGLEWVKQSPGPHQVCFRAVAGYTTPPCQNVTLTAGATTVVTGTFVRRGYLQVTTSPAVASQIRVDGVPRDNWGVYTDLATGSHEVCFGAVAGYTPPPCQTVQVTAGTTTSVIGAFTASESSGLAGTGLLRVTTSPALPSQITVDGVIADSWGLDWLQLTPGSRTVCFAAVEGYTEPACQSVSVTAGATTTVTGTFARRGFLKVLTSPALGATISIDGVTADDWGVFTDLPPRTYQVCFGAVAGRTAPACQSAVVTPGGTTTVTGTYT
jgi:alpha-tubulin suppressor-like RCC1 family protein